MRGPLFSGALGSAVTLRRVVELVRDRAPVVVLSSLWLGEALATELPVLALLESDQAAAARRAARKKTRSPRSLAVALAGEALPVAPGVAGAIVLEDLGSLALSELVIFLLGLAAVLRPGGRVLALDGTKDRAVEARLAGAFLAAGLLGVGQERPRDGALLTLGAVAQASVQKALVAAHLGPAAALPHRA